MLQNFHLVWLDASIDEVNNEDCRKSITKLQKVVNTVNTFTDMDECIDFINGIKEEKTFMISSGALGQTTVPMLHDKPQVSKIYIFCGNKARHEQWTKKWPKVEGVYTDITPICEALKQDVHNCDQNSISMSFVKTADGASNQNLDTLDQSFMYTQILKEILLTINFEQGHINEFLTYCREQFAGNSIELKNVEKLEKEYHRHQPIWWYTHQCFLYSMLNRALRMMEVDLIIKMGFFIRDLHQNITALHFEQYGGHHHSESFIVYRGQGLCQTDFDQLKQTPGGLLSFNNFLSTSLDRPVSHAFAESNQYNTDLIGVLFEININSSISSSPFANVGNASYYQTEKEILFSMHSIFRIGKIQRIDKNDRLWQVDLTLTSENDPQLHALTESMREETFSSYKGWHQLGKLMIKLSHFNKAKELHEILLKQTTNEDEKAHLYHMLGLVEYNQGEYAEAVGSYKKSINIKQKILSPTHSDLACSYTSLGSVYDNMGEYPKALSSHEKALAIYQKTLPPNSPDLANSYNNIGTVYYHMGEYSKALSYYKKDIEISQKTRPANHPDFATSYNNIGLVYDSMGEYSTALSSHEKALEIKQKTLPAYHPELATSYNNIGSVYEKMGEYSKALSFYERTIDIGQRSLPANHPNLRTTRKSIERVKTRIEKLSPVDHTNGTMSTD
jgi:tetratricopeptide (TPR) repeat protein